MTDADTPSNPEVIEFKKPIFIGRVGKLSKRADTTSSVTEQASHLNCSGFSSEDSELGKRKVEISSPFPYKEPKWSGLCPDGSGYALEILKSGMILERVELTNQSFYVFGRLSNCDIVMSHPTASRYHAVLQYKAFAEEGEPPSGWYLYDLNSTHGTFHNGVRLKQEYFSRVRVGHQIKFGTSSRTYIMMGPDYDCEGESDLTVTEIKQKAQEMKLAREKMIQEALEQKDRDTIAEEKKREEQGIDWGMGEDAEEEPDLTDNPYAVAANEELYLDDPKKTLRGYFEREGHELNYNCEERGVGQFICRVELPMDDARGKSVVAEVIHRGKKKEAVVACALEACRILDRAGLLRQAKHESRRRKQRDWGADDYYDSDEDTFLDRTGSVEHKRHRRMRKHGALPPEDHRPRTYDDLLKDVAEIERKISAEEKVLERLRESGKPVTEVKSGEDALDEYMSSLGRQGQTMAQKAEISNSKLTIQKLKVELSKTQRLAELARPADAPPLVKKDDKRLVKLSNSVVYGKRIKLKEDLDKKPKPRMEIKTEETEFVEEMDSDEEEKTIEFNIEQKELSEAARVTRKDKIEMNETVGTDVPLKMKEEDHKIVNDTLKLVGHKDNKYDESGAVAKDKAAVHRKKQHKNLQVNNDNKIETKQEFVSDEFVKVKVEGEHKKSTDSTAQPAHHNDNESQDNTRDTANVKRVFGPMRPPENYMIPDNYFDQETDRDLPEIEEKDSM